MALRIVPTRVQLVIGGSSINEKVHYEATFTLIPQPEPTTDPLAINPANEEILFTLSRGTPDGSQTLFYPLRVPAGSMQTADGLRFTIKPTVATDLGINELTLTNAGGQWTMTFKDNDAILADISYATVYTFLQIGDDPGCAANGETHTGNVWQLNG